MDVSDISLLSRLLDTALALPPPQREPWLAALPQGQAHLAETLRSLLREHDADGAAQRLDRLPALDDDAEASAAWAGARAGELIGPYRLLRELGRGGMGIVWLAERADGAYQRQVALKLPRLAWDEGLAERMARERTIAARLEHAHIARLYDAGVDQHGRPYLALQFIDGVPIDRYADARQLGLRERLALFLPVARAVAYAHARLVVHRDIKPANVLVTADGSPQLLDFGIAKLLMDTRDADATLEMHETRGAAMGLTPGYASPEQLRGEPITVASDVFSLGVLLFELLTGVLPWDRNQRLQQPAAQDAPLASSRAGGQARALRGELDAVLAKALHPAVAGRYATADALANDIQRYLDAEPVLARKPSGLLRLGKAVQRHRLAFAAGGVVALSLVVAAGVSIVTARRAEEAADRAQAVRDFVIDVFRVNARDNPAKTQLRQLPAEMLLERGARLIESKFAGRPALQAELYGVVADIFVDMASPTLAVDYAHRQLASLQAMHAPSAELARASLLLARAQLDGEKPAEAQASARAALRLVPDDPAFAARAHLLLADSMVRMAQDKEAQQELALARGQLARLKPASPALQAEAARLEANRLNFLQNQFDQAMPLYAQAIKLALSGEGHDSPRAFTIRADLAYSLINRHRGAEAQPYLQAALADQRALGGPEDVAAAMVESSAAKWMYVTDQMPYDQARALIVGNRQALAAHALLPESTRAMLDFQLGGLEVEGGQFVPAYALLHPAVQALRSGVKSPWLLHTLTVTLGRAAAETGHHAEAAALLAESLQYGKRSVGANSPWLATAYTTLAMNLIMQQRHAEAQAFLAGVPMLDPVRGESHAPLRARDEIDLVRSLLALEQGDARAALQRLPTTPGTIDDDPVLDRRLLRGAALCALGRSAEGLPLMQGQVLLAAQTYQPEHPGLAYWRAQTGLCALAAGKRSVARSLDQQAHRTLDPQDAVADYFRRPLARLDLQLR